MAVKNENGITVPPYGLNRMDLLVDDLLQTGLTNTTVSIVMPDFKAACNYIRRDVITEMDTVTKKGKKSLLNNTRQVLVEVYDRLYSSIQQFRRRNDRALAYNSMLYELKKVMLFIEQRWPMHCSGDVKASDRDIYEIRAIWSRKFRILKKQCRCLDKALGDAIVQTLLHFISTKQTHEITVARIAYINNIFLMVEGVFSHVTATKNIDTEMVHVLVSNEFNAPLFVAYYKQYLSVKIQSLASYEEKMIGFQLALAELKFFLPVTATPLYADSPSLQSELCYWITASISLLEEKERMSRFQKQPVNENRKPEKIIYKEPAFVVAEIYKMFWTCGLIVNNSFAQLCNALIETGDMGKTPSSSGAYLEAATRRNKEKARKIIKAYILKFQEYLNSDVLL